MPKIADIPNHVAIIMDGNGRWAARRGLSRLAGHRAGTDNIHRVIECFAEHEVKYLTLFAFSTENWSRPRREVKWLLRILEEMLSKETRKLHEKGIKLLHLGRLDRLPPRLKQAIRDAIELTKDNTQMTVNIAFDYGGRAEIVDAFKRILRDAGSLQRILLHTHFLARLRRGGNRRGTRNLCSAGEAFWQIAPKGKKGLKPRLRHPA
jgi:undecaprenyl diphosphate synthase